MHPIESIKKENLVICEGKDDELFLRNISLKIFDTPILDNFQVLSIGGKNSILSWFDILTKRETSLESFKIKSISVIFDADNDPNATIMSIKNAFWKNGFTVPQRNAFPECDQRFLFPYIKTGFLVLPSCDENIEKGELEDFCVKSLDANHFDDKLKEDVSQLVEKRAGLKKPAKNKLHALFSMTNDFVGMKVGEAAKAGAFSLHSEHLQKLKSFLLSMMEQAEPKA